MPCLGLSLRYAVAHLLEIGAKALEEECELPPIKSTNGIYKVDLVRAIVTNKMKSNGETVSIFEGVFEGKEVIAKCYVSSTGLYSVAALHEIRALRELRNCEYTPTLIVEFWGVVGPSQLGNCLVMRKLPGHSMLSRPIWPVWNRRSYKAASVAFEEALSAVHAKGVDNGSHHAGNVIYDSEEKKCYIIDFERATFHRPEKEEPPRATFEDWVGRGPFI